MPGEDEVRVGIREGLGDDLAQALNLDHFAASIGRRRAERQDILGTIGERGLVFVPSERLEAPSRLLAHLDLNGLFHDLVGRLSGQCHGYVLRVLEPAGPGLTVHSGLARGTADGNVLWNPDVRMHVASVSKLITAIAATKALHAAGVPGTAQVWPWLPQYWQPRGPNIDSITFDMLMTHSAGLLSPVADLAEFGEVKEAVYRGALLGVDLGPQRYQNVNFSMLRVLIPVLAGAVKPSLTAPGGSLEDTDRRWDAVTIQAYGDYVREHVFGPARVVDGRTASAPGDALAYQWPMPAAGWDSGDLASSSGTISWHLSAHDLVSILDAFLDGQIVPAERAHAMLEDQCGIDQMKMTDAGPYFLKSGRWESGANQLAQAVAGVLPGGLPFALLVNSQVGADTPGLIDIAATVVRDHVTRGA